MYVHQEQFSVLSLAKGTLFLEANKDEERRGCLQPSALADILKYSPGSPVLSALSADSLLL